MQHMPLQDDDVLGAGGAGKVVRGKFKDTAAMVAIKRVFSEEVDELKLEAELLYRAQLRAISGCMGFSLTALVQ
jgi:hypothetical protein